MAHKTLILKVQCSVVSFSNSHYQITMLSKIQCAIFKKSPFSDKSKQKSLREKSRNNFLNSSILIEPHKYYHENTWESAKRNEKLSGVFHPSKADQLCSL